MCIGELNEKQRESITKERGKNMKIKSIKQTKQGISLIVLVITVIVR